jgi:hypothetical protein
LVVAAALFFHHGPPRGAFFKAVRENRCEKADPCDGKCLLVMGLFRIALNFSRKDLADFPATATAPACSVS